MEFALNLGKNCRKKERMKSIQILLIYLKKQRVNMHFVTHSYIIFYKIFM